MEKINEIKQIKKLLSQAKYEDAFKKLDSIFRDSPFANNNIILQGRYSALKNEWNNGTISIEYNSIETNRIVKALLNFLEDYENELIREIGKVVSEDNTTILKQFIFSKSNIEDKFFSSLIEFRTQENKHIIEAIKRLVKYDYRILWNDKNTKISIKFKGAELHIKAALSYGMHTVVFEATDSRDVAYILKVLHPRLYEDESLLFKERHNRIQKLANKSNRIAEILDVYNQSKSEIIAAKIKKYDSDLKVFVLESNLPQNEYFKKISEMFISLCEAVKVLHENSIAHRDIIPSNVLLDKSQHVFLADFDNIQIQDSDETAEDARYRTIDKDYIFFDVFIEPEYVYQLNQFNKDFNISFEEAKKADLYSLNVLLLFCLIKKRFTNNIDLIDFLKSKSGDENSLKLYAIDILDYPDFSGKIDDDVLEFLKKGLNKNKDERHTTIENLIEGFEQIKDNLLPPGDNDVIRENLAIENKSLSDSLESHKSSDIKSKKIATFLAVLFSIAVMLSAWQWFWITEVHEKELKKRAEVHEKELKRRADWNKLDWDIFFSVEYQYQQILKTYMDSSSYYEPLKDIQVNDQIDTSRIKKVDVNVSDVLSPECSPIKGNTDYSNVSLQVKGMNFDKVAILFSGLVDEILISSDKKMGKECKSYSNLNDVFDLPDKLKEEIQITMVFIYYSENSNKDEWSFMRFPRTNIEDKELYKPKGRPWYLTMTKADRKVHEGITIDNEQRNLKVSPPYYSYSTVNKGPIRTIVKKMDIGDNKELIYGIDIELK